MPKLGQYLVAAAVVVVVGLLGAAAWIWSGFYNVSAIRSHFMIVEWALNIGREQSVKFHAGGVEVPDLDNRDRIVLGARHYESGCAPCHGAPGRRPSALQEAMLPEPPRLDGTASEWTPEQLFWIVRNGQKYTGMPHWIAPEREEEVWSVVAFLEQMGSMDEAGYEELAGISESDTDAPFMPQPGQDGGVIGLCMRCHGAPGEAPPSLLVPQLAGQPQEYLERALVAYRDDLRPSGIMQLFANQLDDDLITSLAAAFSAAQPASLDGEMPPTELIQRGARIAASGLPEDDVPACLTCHGASPRFPRLHGLSAPYVEMQLRVFRAGERNQTAYGEIMTAVAERLDDDDIEALAAFLGSLSIEESGDAEAGDAEAPPDEDGEAASDTEADGQEAEAAVQGSDGGPTAEGAGANTATVGPGAETEGDRGASGAARQPGDPAADAAEEQ